MNTNFSAALVFAALLAAVWLGMRIRRHLPEHHLNDDTKDTVKLTMGLVATMSALLLGLLVNSAKGTYDATRSQVIQMAAKATLLDRTLVLYGAETATVRAQFRALVAEGVRSMWPEPGSGPVRLTPNVTAGDAFWGTLQQLAPHDDTQRGLKNQAAGLAVDLAQTRSLLLAQSVSSVSTPLLIAVVSWLVVIFFSFSLLAPSNTTATLALTISACSVAGAIFLILQLDRPFSGLIRISSAPMLNALSHLAK